MNHIHFEQINSTQSYLMDNYSELHGDTLVSADTQTAGRGQYERKWDSQNKGLFLSCLMLANETLSLTSLEIGTICVHFFKDEFGVDLKLKWPNDILTEKGEKCAGILVHNPGGRYLIVGIGANLTPNTEEYDYPTPIGFILKDRPEYSQKQMSLKLYQYLLKNRLNSVETRRIWNKACIHINSSVLIKDTEKCYRGIFKGIGSMGEAIIEQENGITKSLYTGSLLL